MSQESVKSLNISFIDQSGEKQLYQIHSKAMLGSSSEADIILNTPGIFSKQCVFSFRNGMASVSALEDQNMRIGEQKVQKGRMYILSDQDEISIGSIVLLVNLSNSNQEPPHLPFIEESHSPLTKEDLPDFSSAPPIPDDLSEEKIPEEVQEEIQDEIQYEEEKTKPKIETPVYIPQSMIKDAKEGKGTQYTHSFEDDSTSDNIKKTALTYGSPGFPARLICLCGMFSLSYFFSIYALPSISFVTDALSPLFLIWTEFLSNLLSFLPKEYFGIPLQSIIKFLNHQNTIYFAASFIFLELASHLLLTTSFTKFLAGIRHVGKYANLVSFLRSIIGLFTLPLFPVLDFPAFFHHRTLKEVVTLSKERYINRFLKWPILFIFLPVLSILPLVLPVIEKEDVFSYNINVESKVQPRIKVDRSNSFETVSQTYKLKIRTNKNNDFFFIPKIQKVSGQATMLLYSKEAKTSISLGQIKEFNIANLEIKNNDDILNSLKLLNRENIFNFVLEHGPFLTSHLKVKEFFINSFDLKNKKIQWSNLGRKHFMVISPTNSNERIVYQVVFLDTDKLRSFSIQTTTEGQVLAENFIENYIEIARPLNTQKDKMDYSLIREWTSFNIQDFLNLTPEDINLETVENIAQYFIKQGRSSLAQNDKFMQEKTIQLIRSIDKKFKQSRGSGPYMSQLVLSLNRIQVAIENNDSPFFEYNL